MSFLNKSNVTNGLCLLLIGIGYLLPEPARPHVVDMGFFGFSGAITNWLAVHMLFERVPGLYGSGIIPLKFESFKAAIHKMIMNQFFSDDNLRKFLNAEAASIDFEPIIENLDYDRLFDGFMEVVRNSKFGGMLAFVGGVSKLEGMRGPFAEKLKEKLLEMVRKPDFLKTAVRTDFKDDLIKMWQEKITVIVEKRLGELTPQMVKEIIQEMIRSHLGWLVVWGGVFGCIIGLVSSFIK